jgi:hypothetical protein
LSKERKGTELFFFKLILYFEINPSFLVGYKPLMSYFI